MLVCHQAFFAKRTLVEPYNLKYRFSADFDWCIRIMKKAPLHNTRLTIIDYLDEGMTTQTGKPRLKNVSGHYGAILRSDSNGSLSCLVRTGAVQKK